MIINPERLAQATYRENFHHLLSFDTGYSWCLSRLGWIARQPDHEAFDRWLTRKLGLSGPNLGTSEALYASAPNGDAAVELLRSLYREFTGADFLPEKGERWPDQETDPENLTPTLASIRERPTLYLGARSIFALRNFVDGYALALQREGGRAIRIPDLAGFEAWLSQQVSDGPVIPWERRLYLRRDESAALDAFFLELDAYHAAKAEL